MDHRVAWNRPNALTVKTDGGVRRLALFALLGLVWSLPLAAQTAGFPPGVPAGPTQGPPDAPAAPAAATGKPFSPADGALRQMFEDIMGANAGYLTPDQHREVLRQTEDLARARTRTTPKFEISRGTIPLDPAMPIPVVTMDLGQMSAIAFLDNTGQPWPIITCAWSAGFAGDKPAEGSHLLVLRATTLVDDGSLVCTLKGLASPARLRLSSGTGRHALGFDAMVPATGPNAKPSIHDPGAPPMAAGDDLLSSFLYGVPPPGAEALEVRGVGGDTKAWRLGSELYLRTPMTLLSPGPKAEARREQVTVYRLPPVPVLILDHDGQTVELRIPGARLVRANLARALTTDQTAAPTLDAAGLTP